MARHKAAMMYPPVDTAYRECEGWIGGSCPKNNLSDRFAQLPRLA